MIKKRENVKGGLKVDVLLYANMEKATGRLMFQTIGSVVDPEEIEMCQTVTCLINRFRRPVHNLAAVILIIENQEQFAEILAINKLLAETRKILIFPNDQEDMTIQALELFPSYMSYSGKDFSEIRQVLGKIKTSQEH